MARRVCHNPSFANHSDSSLLQDGDLVAGITAYADGPEEMREVIRHHVDLGVDQIKLDMSGEELSQHISILNDW